MYRVRMVFDAPMDTYPFTYPFYSVAVATMEEARQMVEDLKPVVVHAISVQYQESTHDPFDHTPRVGWRFVEFAKSGATGDYPDASQHLTEEPIMSSTWVPINDDYPGDQRYDDVPGSVDVSYWGEIGPSSQGLWTWTIIATDDYARQREVDHGTVQDESEAKSKVEAWRPT